MCVNPRLLTDKNGLQVEVACRKCWQCVANRQNDWVGRCIAEEQTSSVTTVVHLTYGGDDKVTGLQTDLGASILIYSDVMKWLKRVRFHGFPLRFFCVGEYGSLKGRAHWHVICFWQKASPEFIDGKRNFEDRFWPHGFTMTEGLRGTDQAANSAERAIRYVTKYLQKTDETSQSLVRMSRLPPLGAAWFRQRAVDHVRQRLLPQDAFYSFGDLVDVDGRPKQFKLAGASLDLFCRSFIEEWRLRYGNHPLDVAHSDFLLAWCDAQAARLVVEDLEVRKMGARPSLPVPDGYQPYRLWETRNVYFTEPVDTFLCRPRLYWSYDKEGFRAWSERIVTEAVAIGIRSERTKSKDSDGYRRESGR